MSKLASVRPRDAAELAAWLASRPGPVRVVGSGSRQHRVPPAPPAARTLSLGALATIDRLDAEDHTCSVGAGLSRTELDAALAERNVELPCLGSGTLGGLFAHDPIGATTAGGPAPRSLLLGCDAVLADGTPFRSGARVVKSVAGFDVHTLLPGSNGRLFVVTRLHLRLRPRPRVRVWFTSGALDAQAALRRLTALRREVVPPAVLQLQRDEQGACCVRGCFAGRATFVAERLRAHELHEGPPLADRSPQLAAGAELLTGIVLPSALPLLLAATAPAPLVFWGGGRFEVALAPAVTDAVLPRLPSVPAHAVVTVGAPERLGRGTPVDPGHRRTEAALKQALDPDGVLV